MRIENQFFAQEFFEVYEWRHACAILMSDFPEQFDDIVAVLTEFRIRRDDITVGGGGKSRVAQSLDKAFSKRKWIEKAFDTEIHVDKVVHRTPTHKVDCVKGRVALELEWSNKDPFFDRDLNNFRLLFDLRAISVGVIITKSDELREIFETLDIWKKYGTSTTWINKLIPRIEGGGGGGCPILAIGLKKALYIDD